MTSAVSPASESDLVAQRALSRGQASSIASLRGGKSVWLPLILELVRLIGDGRAVDLNATVELSIEIADVEHRQVGTSPNREPATWREYYGFLRGLKLAESTAGGLHLTPTGLKLRSDPTPERLSAIMADRIRLFAETLSVIAAEPLTVDEVDDRIRESYRQTWRTRGNTRSRMDWQEVLGLIEGFGNRRWSATSTGRALLDGRTIVTPEAFSDEHGQEQVVDIAEPPTEIAELLDELRASNRTHESRSTYNIWVPSPSSHPNKVENLRTIVNAAFERIEREELFTFICQTFRLKRTSVESMLPFMRASGLLLEVGRGIYQATPAARVWIESGDDLNFVRILHANMRFVGEMIRAVEEDVPRNVMYAQAAKFGLNKDKCRWIAGFLLNTDLIEEPRYGSLRATSRGLSLVTELPLANVPTAHVVQQDQGDPDQAAELARDRSPAEDLVKVSREPLSGGMASGKAFELAICNVFIRLGFEARSVGGSGDTDVLVQWFGSDGTKLTAIIEAKARSTGGVTHTDVSDVALETHKNRHQAGHVAIVGPAFVGETIKNMAIQKCWALLEAERLGTLAEESLALGLRPCEIGVMFQVPNGLSDLEDLIAARGRELEIMSFVISKFAEEASESGEAISARDISRDGRRTELSPSVDEVVAAISTVQRLQVEALRPIDEVADPKFATYILGDVSAGAAQLRSMADALERGSGRLPSSDSS